MLCPSCLGACVTARPGPDDEPSYGDLRREDTACGECGGKGYLPAPEGAVMSEAARKAMRWFFMEAGDEFLVGPCRARVLEVHGPEVVAELRGLFCFR